MCFPLFHIQPVAQRFVGARRDGRALAGTQVGRALIVPRGVGAWMKVSCSSVGLLVQESNPDSYYRDVTHVQPT